MSAITAVLRAASGLTLRICTSSPVARNLRSTESDACAAPAAIAPVDIPQPHRDDLGQSVEHARADSPRTSMITSSGRAANGRPPGRGWSTADAATTLRPRSIRQRSASRCSSRRGIVVDEHHRAAFGQPFGHQPHPARPWPRRPGRSTPRRAPATRSQAATPARPRPSGTCPWTWCASARRRTPARRAAPGTPRPAAQSASPPSPCTRPMCTR